MSEQPLITIGITCFNAADTIERAVESALKQTWVNKEIIVIDDCSTDNSLEILKKYEPLNVRLIRQDVNQGPGAARQKLLEAAQGEYLVFFDDDDAALPERVLKQYERLSSYETKTGSGLVACYASGARYYANGYNVPIKAIGTHDPVPHGPLVADFILFFKKQSSYNYGVTPSCALMAKVSTFKQVGGFDPALRRVEDLDFAIRLALAGGYFVGCEEKLFLQYATQASDKAPLKNLEAELTLAEKHKEYLKKVGRYEYARQWPRIRYYHFMRQHVKMLAALLSLFMHAPIKTTCHILETGPKRLLHERKMKKVTAV